MSVNLSPTHGRGRALVALIARPILATERHVKPFFLVGAVAAVGAWQAPTLLAVIAPMSKAPQVSENLRPKELRPFIWQPDATSERIVVPGSTPVAGAELPRTPTPPPPLPDIQQPKVPAPPLPPSERGSTRDAPKVPAPRISRSKPHSAAPIRKASRPEYVTRVPREEIEPELSDDEPVYQVRPQPRQIFVPFPIPLFGGHQFGGGGRGLGGWWGHRHGGWGHRFGGGFRR